MSRRELIVWIILCLIVFLAVLLSCIGCNGNSAAIKPSNHMETALKNQQAMKESIDSVGGDLVKVQETMTVIENTVTQTFETIQGSVKTGDVAGDVNSSHDSNSMWYGIGLVVVVLIFALILIWGMARMMKGLVGKVFK